MKIELTSVFILTLFLTFGQTDQEFYQQKYPNKNGVFLNKSEHVSVEIGKNGSPEIESTISEERLFLNDNYKFYIEDDVMFNSFSEISKISASVYTPNGEKYKKSKVSNFIEEDATSRNVFHDDLKRVKFVYSGLTKGGKTSLEYTEELNEPYFFGTFYFSSYLPVEKSEYTITTPADMEIAFELFGKEKDKVKYTVETKGKSKIHTWVATGLNELDYKRGSVSSRYFATHLQVRITTYKDNSEEKFILRDVNDLYTYYRGFVSGVNQEISDGLAAIADSLTKDFTTESDKVRAIFYWVQDQIKYVAFEDGMGGFVPREANLVCERKYGDCKDMASVLYAMINSVGVPAYYTWIGTRDIPYSYNTVPTPAVDNHMICSFFDGNNYIFLDATGKGIPFGMPTSFIQGKQALVGINDEKFELVEVPVIPNKTNQTIDSVRISLDEKIVQGTGKVTYTGYSAAYFRDFLQNLSKSDKTEYYKKSFKKGNNKCESQVMDEFGLGDRDSSLAMTYKFELPDYVRENNDEIYLNPFLKKYYSDSKINLETSKLDMENPYKEVIRNVTLIEIPDGYKLEFIPEDMSYTNDKFNADIQFFENSATGEVEVTTTVSMDHLILETEYFENWNEMIRQLNKSYSELIIFKKEKE